MKLKKLILLIFLCFFSHLSWSQSERQEVSQPENTDSFKFDFDTGSLTDSISSYEQRVMKVFKNDSFKSPLLFLNYDIDLWDHELSISSKLGYNLEVEAFYFPEKMLRKDQWVFNFNIYPEKLIKSLSPYLSAGVQQSFYTVFVSPVSKQKNFLKYLDFTELKTPSKIPLDWEKASQMETGDFVSTTMHTSYSALLSKDFIKHADFNLDLSFLSSHYLESVINVFKDHNEKVRVQFFSGIFFRSPFSLKLSPVINLNKIIQFLLNFPDLYFFSASLFTGSAKVYKLDYAFDLRNEKDQKSYDRAMKSFVNLKRILKNLILKDPKEHMTDISESLKKDSVKAYFKGVLEQKYSGIESGVSLYLASLSQYSDEKKVNLSFEDPDTKDLIHTDQLHLSHVDQFGYGVFKRRKEFAEHNYRLFFKEKKAYLNYTRSSKEANIRASFVKKELNHIASLYPSLKRHFTQLALLKEKNLSFFNYRLKAAVDLFDTYEYHRQKMKDLDEFTYFKDQLMQFLNKSLMQERLDQKLNNHFDSELNSFISSLICLFQKQDKKDSKKCFKALDQNRLFKEQGLGFAFIYYLSLKSSDDSYLNFQISDFKTGLHDFSFGSLDEDFSLIDQFYLNLNYFNFDYFDIWKKISLGFD